MSEDKLAQFAKQNYINLQTFKKDGTPVATPVWFAEDGGELYVMREVGVGETTFPVAQQTISCHETHTVYDYRFDELETVWAP